MMRVYISGPITGQDGGNREAFDQAAQALRAAGHEPVNPHEVCADMPSWATWSEYMRRDLEALQGCDAVLRLPGWHHSKGAAVEVMLALREGRRVVDRAEELEAVTCSA